jgi:hypothetical protein
MAMERFMNDEEMMRRVIEGIPIMPVKAGSPTTLMVVPALLEHAGYVKKKEWVGLTEKETNALIQRWAGELIFEVSQALKEKNGF